MLLSYEANSMIKLHRNESCGSIEHLQEMLAKPVVSKLCQYIDQQD